MGEDVVSAHIAEFNALRAESLQHFTIANALIAAEIAGLGISAPLLVQHEEWALGLSILSSYLWLSYMDHIASIHRIALYLGSDLRGKVERTLGTQVFGWERWLRVSGSLNGMAGRPQTLPQSLPSFRERHLGLSYASGLYATTSFGGLLLGAYAVIADWKSYSLVLLLLALASGTLLRRALAEHVTVSAFMRSVNRALLRDDVSEDFAS